jgi:hypothetical protein
MTRYQILGECFDFNVAHTTNKRDKIVTIAQGTTSKKIKERL